MSEREVIMAALDEAGVSSGIRWAFTAAVDRTLDDYSEAAGHDTTWLGMTRFTLFRDRLDRVFACGRYAVPPGASASSSLDVVHAELTEAEVAAMPVLAADLVQRADLNGSPGWAWQGRRFLLASCAFGKLDELPWPQKSPTKQRVALQRVPEVDQGSLFEDFSNDELGGLQALLSVAEPLELDTFAVAHTLSPETTERELTFGRPRLNIGGGDPWHWRANLLSAPTGPAGTRTVPAAVEPDSVPDAPVRLRQVPAARTERVASDE